MGSSLSGKIAYVCNLIYVLCFANVVDYGFRCFTSFSSDSISKKIPCEAKLDIFSCFMFHVLDKKLTCSIFANSMCPLFIIEKLHSRKKCADYFIFSHGFQRIVLAGNVAGEKASAPSSTFCPAIRMLWKFVQEKPTAP